MAFNGSGTFSRLFNWTTDKGNAVPVTASRTDSELDGFATGLSTTICKDGQTVTTLRIPFVLGTSAMQGAVGGVSYSFTNDVDTGLYSPATDQLAWAAGGVQVLSGTSTTITVPVALAVTGASVFTGEIICSATATFTTLGKFTSTSHMLVPSGTTGQRPGSPAGGNARYNTTTSAFEVYNGTAWIGLKGAPTFQTFTSGSAATYTTPTGATWLRIRMIAAGGGAGAAGTAVNNGGTGGTGGTTTFNSINATGGTGGTGGGVGFGLGGAGGTGGSGTATLRFSGGTGAVGVGIVSGAAFGGSGGSGAFGGGGGATTATGGNGAPNTGGGGAGGTSATGSSLGGGGGGAGEYVEIIIANPAGTYTYTVGAAGAAGASGGSGSPGGAGAAGIIIVEEHYN